MLKAINRQTVIGVWGVALVALAVGGSLSGISIISITAGTGALLLVACVVPPAVMLMVWRGAAPPTVAEILYAADRRD